MPKNILVNARELRANNRSKNREIHFLRDKIYKKNNDIIYHYNKFMKYETDSKIFEKKLNILSGFYADMWCKFMNVNNLYDELLEEFVDELIENEEIEEN